MATPHIFDQSDTTANLNKLSFEQAFVRYMPGGTAPLFEFTSRLPSSNITNIEHGYFTKTMSFGAVTLTAAVADGNATIFTVASTAKVVPGQLYRANSTGEVVMVASVTNATTLVVVRGFGDIAAAAIANSVVLYCVGNVSEEASNRPQAVRLDESYVTNYTQIFRNTWLLSNTQAAIEQNAGLGQVAEDKNDCAALHARDIETALFFGQKKLTTANNQRIHTMQGLEGYIRNYAAGNISTAGGTTTYDQLLAMLDPCFNTQVDPKSANQRVLFCGRTAINVINKIGRLSGEFTLNRGQTAFGLRFNEFSLPRGDFMMVEHPLFNANADWQKMAIAVDPTTINLAYLRRTSHQDIGRNGQYVENSLDAVGGVLTSELTMMVKNPSANAIIYGLTAGA